MYTLKKPDGEVTYNKKEIIRVLEDFYRDPYNSNEQPRCTGKTPGEDGISIDLIKDAGEIATVKLDNLF